MKCPALSLSLAFLLLGSMAAATLYDDLLKKLGTEPLPAMFQFKDGEGICECKQETTFSKLGLVPSRASVAAAIKDVGDNAAVLAPNLVQKAAEVQKLNGEASGASVVAARKDVGDIAAVLAPNLVQKAAEVQKLNDEGNVAAATTLSEKIDPDMQKLRNCINAMFNAVCCHKATTIGTPGKIKTVDDVIARVKNAPKGFKIDKRCQEVTLQNSLNLKYFGLF